MHDDTICIDGVKFSADKKTLIYFPESCPLREYTIPEGVTTIGRGAFYDAGVQFIVIPESVTKISEEAFFELPLRKAAGKRSSICFG